MNVVFIITRADVVGGATVHVRDLARGMMDQGHRILVLVGGTGEATEEFARAGVPFRSLRWLGRALHPVKDVLAIFEMKRVLAELQPDLICAHTAKAGLVGRFAAKPLGIPAFYTPHGWPIGDRISANGAWIFRIAERAAASRSASIINVCEAERALARRHRIAPGEKLAVIHNGVHDVAPALRARPELAPTRIIMVARFERQKDHATLLAAMSLLREIPWELELVGDGPRLPATRALAGRLGLESRIHFTGSAGNVSERIADSQIFVLSSCFEGFPLSILEAMRAGLPVVASNVGGVREAVLEGETGFVVKPADPVVLASALRKLIADPAMRASFGLAGRRRYEAHFTFEQMLRQTLSLYQSVLSNPAMRSGVAPDAKPTRLASAKEAASGR